MLSTKEFAKEVSLSEEDLAVFHVSAASGSGKLFLRISQGEASKYMDISGSFSESVDMSEFHSGRVRLALSNDAARDASIAVSWRG
jgi:hypothetical protein